MRRWDEGAYVTACIYVEDSGEAGRVRTALYCDGAVSCKRRANKRRANKGRGVLSARRIELSVETGDARRARTRDPGWRGTWT